MYPSRSLPSTRQGYSISIKVLIALSLMIFSRTSRISAFCLKRSSRIMRYRYLTTTGPRRSGISTAFAAPPPFDAGSNKWTTTQQHNHRRVSLALTTRDYHSDVDGSTSKTDNNNDTIIRISAGTTVQDAYDCGVHALHASNVVEPEASVPQLLAFALDLDWETGYRTVMQPQYAMHQTLTKQQAITLRKLLERRLNHEPIQYILGQWDFLDYVIAIRPPLLCPRPETEELVQMVLHDAKQIRMETGKDQLKILDIGCGTGVIGISLADQLDNTRVHAIDIEPMAVETSLENARRILSEGRLEQYQCSLIPVAEYSINEDEEPFDLVVSNPPYIPTSDYNNLSADVINFESRDALEAGEDGLTVIRDIIKGMRRWCKPGAPCWMEVDPTHPKIIEELLSSSENKAEFGVEFVSSSKDMFGKDRFVKLKYIGDNEN